KPDFVKIDRNLIQGLGTSLLRKEVARSIVRVAARVHCRVVAPGIESEAAARAAGQCGVAMIQGFHLARPQPAVRLSDSSRRMAGGAPGS
ncbi:MAG: EAL domain-containing protein, partial [Acidobacteriota bacterium]